VVIISPKRVAPVLALIIGAGELAGHLSHKPAHLQALGRIDQQMDMVGRNAVIKHPDIELPQVLTDFGPVCVTIASELQQECAVVTAMG
jgi:hypothetical protein